MKSCPHGTNYAQINQIFTFSAKNTLTPNRMLSSIDEAAKRYTGARLADIMLCQYKTYKSSTTKHTKVANRLWNRSVHGANQYQSEPCIQSNVTLMQCRTEQYCACKPVLLGGRIPSPPTGGWHTHCVYSWHATRAWPKTQAKSGTPPTREAELSNNLRAPIIQSGTNRHREREAVGGGRRTGKEGGLAERLLGVGADIARGVERGRQALHQPPLVAVRRAPGRHRNRRVADARLGLGLRAELVTSTPLHSVSKWDRARRGGGGKRERRDSLGLS